MEALYDHSYTDVIITPTALNLLCPDATSIDNSPGDTTIDEVGVAAGGAGHLVLGRTNVLNEHLLTPELTYGLVLDTVG